MSEYVEVWCFCKWWSLIVQLSVRSGLTSKPAHASVVGFSGHGTLGFAYGAVVKSFDSFVFLCCCLNCSVRVATAVVPSYVEQMRQDSILEKWRAPHDCWAPPGCHRCSDKRSGTVGVGFWWKCISEAKSSYVYLEVYVHIIVLYYDFVGLDISWNICLSRRLCLQRIWTSMYAWLTGDKK